MSGPQLHVLVNHVSLFTMAFGACILIASMVRKSADLRMAASALFIVGGFFAWLSDFSGDRAADVIRELDPTLRDLIHTHAEAADWALTSGILVGVLAILLEIIVRKKPQWSKVMTWVVLVFAIHGCTVFARTAHLGGQIRHSELR